MSKTRNNRKIKNSRKTRKINGGASSIPEIVSKAILKDNSQMNAKIMALIIEYNRDMQGLIKYQDLEKLNLDTDFKRQYIYNQVISNPNYKGLENSVIRIEPRFSKSSKEELDMFYDNGNN